MRQCTFVLFSDANCAYGHTFKTLVYLLFMIAPLMFNLTAYVLIVLYLKKHPRLRYLSPRLILIKAVLINITFTLSWLPYATTHDVISLSEHMTSMSDHVIMAVSRVLLYLHCLTNPLLYAFSSVAIKGCLRWADTARSIKARSEVRRNLSAH